MYREAVTDEGDAWPQCAVLYDPDRLTALQRIGLGPTRDPEMDRFARWVRRALAVPSATVTLVQAGRQVFPGRSGLVEPYASTGSTPLSHSFCRHVVTSAHPLVITDARTDPRVRDSLAIPDLGVVAYAGMPLTDRGGNVLGSLCAIDTVPRVWTDEELATLDEIARCCTTELRLRLADFDTGTEIDRREEAQNAERRAHDRSRMLLTASQAFTDTVTVHDVRERIDTLLSSELDPVHVETVLRDRRGRLHTLHGDAPSPPAGDVDPATPREQTTSLLEQTPSALAIREQRLVHYCSADTLAEEHPPEVVATMRALGLQSVVAAPVPGRLMPAGAILLGWDRPDAVDAADLLTIATIVGYAGQALARARDLEHRTSVAHEMQNAMLTVLPTVDGLGMAARYSPADTRLNVGGDWFDVAPLADAAHPHDRVLGLSVGDIIGHDLPAVTIMGQVRSMLRQAAWDHPGKPPSAVVSAFESANLGLDIGARGTTVVAHLHHEPDGRWLMRWTNAGHPAPILLHPDGTTELLDAHDSLFGYEFALDLPRADHERVVEPGTTLVVHTDGLIERPGSDIDAGTEALRAVLTAARHGTPDEIVDAIMATLPDDATDDAVALVVRIG